MTAAVTTAEFVNNPTAKPEFEPYDHFGALPTSELTRIWAEVTDEDGGPTTRHLTLTDVQVRHGRVVESTWKDDEGRTVHPSRIGRNRIVSVLATSDDAPAHIERRHIDVTRTFGRLNAEAEEARSFIKDAVGTPDFSIGTGLPVYRDGEGIGIVNHYGANADGTRSYRVVVGLRASGSLTLQTTGDADSQRAQKVLAAFEQPGVRQRLALLGRYSLEHGAFDSAARTLLHEYHRATNIWR